MVPEIEGQCLTLHTISAPPYTCKMVEGSMVQHPDVKNDAPLKCLQNGECRIQSAAAAPPHHAMHAS
jgi:hypothetical protein